MRPCNFQLLDAKKRIKMKKTIVTVLSVLCMAMPVGAADGVVNVSSAFSVEETADRLVNVLKEKGMILFKRVNHTQGAQNVGLELRDTEVIIFGNPKVGTPLMQCQQSVAIDLPQKVLIWEDDQAKVWVSYNDPRYLERRHSIPGCEETIAKIEKALDGIAKSATTQQIMGHINYGWDN